MLKYLLVLTLLLGVAAGIAYACDANTTFSAVTTNNGHAINESSYKTRALRAWMMWGSCVTPINNNLFTCTSDHCDSTDTANRPSWRLASCFDLPTCSAWACRECRLQRKWANESAWTDVNMRFEYQQGYPIATIFDDNTAHTYTENIGASPVTIHRN